MCVVTAVTIYLLIVTGHFAHRDTFPTKRAHYAERIRIINPGKTGFPSTNTGTGHAAQQQAAAGPSPACALQPTSVRRRDQLTSVRRRDQLLPGTTTSYLPVHPPATRQTLRSTISSCQPLQFTRRMPPVSTTMTTFQCTRSRHEASTLITAQEPRAGTATFVCVASTRVGA